MPASLELWVIPGGKGTGTLAVSRTHSTPIRQDRNECEAFSPPSLSHRTPGLLPAEHLKNPANTLRPSARVTRAAFAVFDPSWPYRPPMVIIFPVFREFLVQPSLIRAVGIRGLDHPPDFLAGRTR